MLGVFNRALHIVVELEKLSFIMNKQFIYIAVLVVAMMLTGCINNNTESEISDTRFIMGTVVTIQLFDIEDETLITESFNKISEIENLISLNIESSELNGINNHAGQGPYKISANTYYVIEEAIKYSVLSKGKFDISMEPVISLWKIGTKEAAVPDREELLTKLNKVGYEQIILDEVNQTVELLEGVKLDLGSIGKGFAADIVAKYLRGEGVKKAIINLGGNILVIGEKAKGIPYRVGLQNPYEKRNEYFAVVEVADKTVVTSGIYERNFTKDNILYHHILSTKDGYPVDNGVVCVTVVADASIDADALSTVLFLEGIEKGLKLANSIEGIECIYVDENSKFFLSEHAGEIFELLSDEFQLVDSY